MTQRHSLLQFIAKFAIIATSRHTLTHHIVICSFFSIIQSCIHTSGSPFFALLQNATRPLAVGAFRQNVVNVYSSRVLIILTLQFPANLASTDRSLLSRTLSSVFRRNPPGKIFSLEWKSSIDKYILMISNDRNHRNIKKSS